MNKNLSLRARLLGTSALAVGAFMLTASPAAAAGCSGAFVDGGHVVCSGNNYYAINTNTNNLTVTLNPSATLAYGNDPVVDLGGDSNILQLKSGSAITAYDSYGAVGVFGDNSKITLDGNASITLHNYGSSGGSFDKYEAVLLGGNGSTLTLNGGSTITAIGGATSGGSFPHSKYTGVASYGLGQSILLNGGSEIDVAGTGAGDNKYVGISAFGAGYTSADSSSITLNSGSSIKVSGSGSDGNKYIGALTFGVGSPGDKYAPSLTLNGGSTIDLAGQGGTGNKYLGVFAIGEKSKITLNGGSSINLTGTGADNKYVGVFQVDTRYYASDPASTVTLNNSSINIIGSGNSTGNAKYIGIMAYGDSSGPEKYAPHVTLNDSAINITGHSGNGNYAGILAYGDDGKIALTGNSSITLNGPGNTTGFYSGIGLHGDHGTVSLSGGSRILVGSYANSPYAIGIAVTGSDDKVTLSGDSSITIYDGQGSHSAGIGMADGADGSITLNDNSRVVTFGAPALYLDHMSDANITLNGTSFVRAVAAGAAAIYVYHSDGTHITLNGSGGVSGGTGIALINSDNTSVTIGHDARVGGIVGIYADGDHTNIDVSGRVYAYGINAIDVSHGTNSTVTLNSGAIVQGRMLGAGSGDQLVLRGEGRLYGDVHDFATLTVEAQGIWNTGNSVIDLGSGSAVTIDSGTLAVNGSLTADTVTVNAGGTLGGSGTVYGNVVDYGAISPGNSPGTLHLVGNMTFNSGSSFIVQSDGVASDLLDVTGDVAINPNSKVVPQFIGGVDGFAGPILTYTGTLTGTFSGASGGALSYTVGTVSLTAVSPSSVNGGLSGGTNTGFTFLDAVSGQTEAGIGGGKSLWVTGLSQNTSRNADGYARGFNQDSRGAAFGWDFYQVDNLTFGVAGGYIDSDVNTEGGGTTTNIDGYNGAFYGSWTMGGTFLTGVVTAAYQNQDVKRNVLSGGVIVPARGTADAWLAGGGLTLGHVIPIEGAWTITPKANLAYLHAKRDGYTETGGGLGGMSVDGQSTDTVRGDVGAALGLTIHDPNASWTVRPALHAALAHEWRGGDETVSGRFNTGGAAFTAPLDTRDQTYMVAGLGVDVGFGHGISAFATYDTASGGTAETSNGFQMGARIEW